MMSEESSCGYEEGLRRGEESVRKLLAEYIGSRGLIGVRSALEWLRDQ